MMAAAAQDDERIALFLPAQHATGGDLVHRAEI